MSKQASFSGDISWPKISIVTPSFNQGKYIEETILSVISQNYPNLEYIIIDGASTDETVEIIKKYSDKITYWISEPDKGQSDALNKGLKKCTGEIFNWINSDDFLAKDALFKIAQAFVDKDTVVVAGAVQNIDGKGNCELFVNDHLGILEMLETDAKYIYHQPGIWMKMVVMASTGIFKVDYHYCFDQEYFLRYLLISDKVKYIPDILAYFRLHNHSKTVSSSHLFLLDFNRMYKEFVITVKGTGLEKFARQKSLHYEWPLIHYSLNNRHEKRLIILFLAVKAILKDPAHRLNRKSVGWLKHIVFGKQKDKKSNFKTNL